MLDPARGVPPVLRSDGSGADYEHVREQQRDGGCRAHLPRGQCEVDRSCEYVGEHEDHEGAPVDRVEQYSTLARLGSAPTEGGLAPRRVSATPDGRGDAQAQR